MMQSILNLLHWERYIPVMSVSEQRAVMQGAAPSAEQIAHWQRLETLRTAKRDAAINKAYIKQIIWKVGY